MNDTIERLRKQLAEAEENLRLIQERKAQYVLETDIPLDLVKRERRLEAEIPRLRARLAELAQAQLDADIDHLRGEQTDEERQSPRRLIPIWAWIAGVVVVVLLIVYRRPMVYVPAGVFKMGSTDDEIDYALELCNIHYGDCERRWFENEQPSHTVALDGFWIGRTEVTNAQFAAFLNDQGNGTEGGMTWLAVEDEDCRIEQKGDEFQPKDGYADHPVIEVTWYGAAAYCGWAGARLPTEAEWEYAARRWEGRIFPWGNRFDGTKLNYCDASCVYDWKDTDYNDGYERTAPVRSLRAGASWCGAFDMAGNVWEWVADWYGDYPYGPQDNPTGPLSGEDRVRRGGSWDNQPDNLRSAARNHSSPDYHYNTIGFRCARDSQ